MITMEMEFVGSTKTMHRYQEKRSAKAEGNNITLYLRMSDLGDEAPQTLFVTIATEANDGG